ncbi:MAG: Ribonuclease [Pseudomonadota bacterium]|jgi:ribonuclease HII
MIVGVDEVGRGPLAGSVVAAAVILPEPCPIIGLADSKQLSEKKRLRLDAEIRRYATGFAIAEVSVTEIDQINILQASLLAMTRAVKQLAADPEQVLAVMIDGNKIPQGLHAYRCQAIIGGDAMVPAISAASIIAKVYRDRLMQELDTLYPDYGFARHKGYGTAMHLAALKSRGPCAVHRKSFAPVAALL